MPAATAKPAPGKPSLTLKRHIKAPVDKVYAAWITPAQLMSWFGPRGGRVLSATLDARVGGRYQIVMVGPDGEEHGVGGVYSEVVPNERLVFSWAWRTMPERESLVTVTMKQDADGTSLTVLHEQFADEQARDRHLTGWTDALERMEPALSL